MWVVAQLLDHHHGQVCAWSSRRQGASGTAFSVFLPLGEKSPTPPPAG
jgi:signal transduction histidine kinase